MNNCQIHVQGDTAQPNAGLLEGDTKLLKKHRTRHKISLKLPIFCL